jgi:dTDP-4-amino-4,6-dideoxygalactose transaminase
MEPKEQYLPFALPDLDGSELEEIKEALESGWVTTGPKVKKFETEFARAVGAKHAIAVNSCTAAMHLALDAVGVKRGDEVITTPYTFAATAEVIRYFDARPVFVDVQPDSLNIDPGLIEAAITSKTKAVIPIHLAGFPADMDPIREVTVRHAIPVIEDAAHTFPSAYHGKPVGSISEFTAFSFYATKTITTGEGGMITTDNDAWEERCRIMSLHGISKDAWKRYTAEGSWYYEIVAPGFKYNMTDVAAAMGLAQLRKAEAMRARRRHIAKCFNDSFERLDQLQTPFDTDDREHSWHLYMLRLNLDRLTIDRARFMEELKKQGIGASVHFIPLHIHPYYRDQFGFAAHDFPVAYTEYLREISLPIYSRMSDDEVRRVIESVEDIVNTHRR